MKIKPFYKLHPNAWILRTTPDIAAARRKALKTPRNALNKATENNYTLKRPL